MWKVCLTKQKELFLKNELKPWKVKGWLLPAMHSADFVANMENVLDVYKLPYSMDYPVICMDESPKQLIAETWVAEKLKDGTKLVDYEYSRKGGCNIFMANEPLAGRRFLKITKQNTKIDWAKFIKEIAVAYQNAKKITLVMDNLNTHKAASLYEAFYS